MTQQKIADKPKETELGKLYEYEATPQQKAKGIKTQWFITNPNSNKLLAGHINDQNEWSVCKEQDLTPSNDWRSKEEVFSNLKQQEQQQNQVQEVLNIDNNDSGDNGDNNNQQSTIEVDDRQQQQKVTPVQLANNPTISGEKQELKEEETEKLMDNPEQTREQMETELAQLLVQSSQNNELNFHEKNNSDQWELNNDEMTNSVQLIDKDDGHTVISVDRDDGIVNSPLSLEDSQKITNSSLDKNSQISQAEESATSLSEQNTSKVFCYIFK